MAIILKIKQPPINERPIVGSQGQLLYKNCETLAKSITQNIPNSHENATSRQDY